MEKKILIDGRLLSNHPTGISRYTQQLIDAFIKKYGNEAVSVIVNREYACAEDYNLIHTRYKPYHPLHFLFFPFFIHKLNFSIYYSPFYSGIWFKKDTRKQVITVHDLMYLRIGKYFSENSLTNSILKFAFNLLVRSTLRASNLVISVSETTRKDLRELFGRDSEVIGEGVNELTTSRLHDTTKARGNDWATSRLNEACEEGYFLYVGNFRKQKNVDFLIEAFLRSDTPYWLVLAGSTTRRLHDKTTSRQDDFTTRRLHQGKSKRENENLRMGNSKRIVFTGALEDYEINNLYQNCVAFVMPSLYEGFGLPVLEACCAGARVFSSNAGALKEFDHLNIHYFSSDNPEELISLLERADQLPKPTEAEIKRVRDIYCWERQMGKLVEKVDEMIC